MLCLHLVRNPEHKTLLEFERNLQLLEQEIPATREQGLLLRWRRECRRFEKVREAASQESFGLIQGEADQDLRPESCLEGAEFGVEPQIN